MSRFFGPIMQVAYVVTEFEAMLEHWTRMLGVGPFYVLPALTFTRLDIRGVPADPHLNFIDKVALAYSGDIQVEIILPGTLPSAFHEFLARGNRGVQHVGVNSLDFDAQLEQATQLGVPIAIQGELPGARFAYIETDVGFPGSMLELTEIGTEARELFDMIKAASIGWNGKEPVRAV